MAENGISTLTVGDPVDWVATKAKRRDEKLKLARTKRQDTNSIGYRVYNQYPDGGPGTVSPAEGHPWTKL